MPPRPLNTPALALAGLALALLLVGCDNHAPTHQRVTLGGEAFHLELALTRSQIRTGLMHRTDLAEDGGMLFVFPDMRVRSFWMKDCLIPLDAVFLDGTGRIVSIREMAVPDPDDRNPPGYSSWRPAQFAIEIEGGRAEELGLEVGQRVDLPLERLKRLVR